MSKFPTKIGVAAINENKDNFYALISEMKATNKKFPINQFGDVNISWIAKQIGCTRGTLTNGTLSKPFKAAVDKIGTEAIQDDNIKNQKSAKKASHKLKDTSELRKAFAKTIKENVKLKQQIEMLTEQLRKIKYRKTEQELRFENFLQDGERFLL